MNRKIKAIAFDLGGVLMTENNYSLSYKASILEKQLGKLNTDNEFINWAMEKTNSPKETVLVLINEIVDNLYELRDKNIFEKLPKLKFAIATNHLTAIRRWIKKSNIEKHLCCIINSAEIGKAKPDPKFFEILSKKINEEPENILYIDDLATNIEAAKKMGFLTLHYNNQNSLADEILKY
jgi:HAD superfamily hydrolase (TIGR01509 family)